jgi:hypothetical protein
MLTQEQQYELNRILAQYQDALADLGEARAVVDGALENVAEKEANLREFIAKVAGG